jgi:hypothetical protein
VRTELAVPLAEPGASPPPPGLGSIFLVFLKLGSIAFGGVYGMLACFERELVERRRWLTAEELAEGVVVGRGAAADPRRAAIAVACLALLLLARANPILLIAASALAGRLWLGASR